MNTLLLGDLCPTVAEKYTRRVGNAGRPESTARENETLAHFLDCEAHTDVLRTLFQTRNLINEKKD